jgi:hypothetical protein
MDDTTGRIARSPDIDTRDIREEIAQTRIEMSETIGAIEDRLRPSHLVARAGETVRNTATEKVNDIANTAGYAANRLMNSSFARTVRANPIPSAMVALAGGWLLMHRRRTPG